MLKALTRICEAIRSNLILQMSLQRYLLHLCSEITKDLCVTFAFCHHVLVMRGNSHSFCARSLLMKHNPELEWPSSFLYPNLILHLLFKNASNKNKREQGRGARKECLLLHFNFFFFFAFQFFALSGNPGPEKAV